MCVIYQCIHHCFCEENIESSADAGQGRLQFRRPHMCGRKALSGDCHSKEFQNRQKQDFCGRQLGLSFGLQPHRGFWQNRVSHFKPQNAKTHNAKRTQKSEWAQSAVYMCRGCQRPQMEVLLPRPDVCDGPSQSGPKMHKQGTGAAPCVCQRS